MQKLSPDLPIVVLTGLDDDELAVQLVQNGVQDYLGKGELSSTLLTRSIRYAIERHQLQMKLENLILEDELTGLYNRRGFFTLAEQQLIHARRTSRNLLLVYADLDDLKKINDNYGHHAGDHALRVAAAILKDTFRASDIIARIGGDEFAVVVLESSEKSADTIKARILQAQAHHNQHCQYDFRVTLGVGITQYNPDMPSSIDALLSQADALMYEQKNSHQDST